MKKLRFSGLVFSFAVVMAVPAYSWAISCNQGAQATALILNSTNTVPENVGGIPGTGAFNTLTLERVDGVEPVAVEFTVVYSMIGDIQIIKPVDWAQGNSYRVVVTTDSPPIDQTVSVIAPFSLSGTPTLAVEYEPSGDDSMFELIAGVVTMQGLPVIDDPVLAPYLAFETLVDDQAWSSGSYCAFGPRPGESAWGLGVERLVAACSPGGDTMTNVGGYFESGSVLDVSMRVSIMGDDEMLQTPSTVVDLDFDCAEQITDEPTDVDVTATPDVSDGDESGCSSATGNSGSLSLFSLIGFFGLFCWGRFGRDLWGKEK